MQKLYNIKTVNDKIENDVRKLILDTESRYRGQLFSLAEKILHKRKINMVLIAGPSCAGKTTSAKLLQEILERRGRHVITISMDDFFIDRDKTPRLPNGERDLDSPYCVNTTEMRRCFESLYAGKVTKFPTYNFITGKSQPDSHILKLKYNSIIIFEGLHVLNPFITDNLGTSDYYKIYVNALTGFRAGKESMKTVDLRLFRRMIRDVERRNYKISETLHNWTEVCIAENKYITPYKKTVNSIINTTHEYELGILKKELDDLIVAKKAKKSEIPFYETVSQSLIVDKRHLPETTLLWEFVEPYSEEQ